MTELARIRAFGHDRYRVRVPHEHRDRFQEHLDEIRYSHFTQTHKEGVDFYFAVQDNLSEIIGDCFDGIEIDLRIESLDSTLPADS